MKFFGTFFVLLNTLIYFGYAQNPEKTCEQEFNLKGTACTPCQQTLHKYSDTTSPPSDKCLVLSIVSSHFDKTYSTPDSPTISKALDKTCQMTANNACSESRVKEVYTEIDKNCDAELKTKGNSGNSVGREAESKIRTYYSAIPMRELLCDKIEGEYCYNNFLKIMNQTEGMANPFNGTICNDCTKHFFSNTKKFQESHPFPNFQNIFAEDLKVQNYFDATCGIPKASVAQKLRNEINSYSTIILIGTIGLFYLSYM